MSASVLIQLVGRAISSRPPGILRAVFRLWSWPMASTAGAVYPRYCLKIGNISRISGIVAGYMTILTRMTGYRHRPPGANMHRLSIGRTVGTSHSYLTSRYTAAVMAAAATSTGKRSPSSAGLWGMVATAIPTLSIIT